MLPPEKYSQCVVHVRLARYKVMPSAVNYCVMQVRGRECLCLHHGLNLIVCLSEYRIIRADPIVNIEVIIAPISASHDSFKVFCCLIGIISPAVSGDNSAVPAHRQKEFHEVKIVDELMPRSNVPPNLFKNSNFFNASSPFSSSLDK